MKKTLDHSHLVQIGMCGRDRFTVTPGKAINMISFSSNILRPGDSFHLIFETTIFLDSDK